MKPHRMIGNSLPRGLDRLASIAASEGFGMVDRLITDYRPEYRRAGVGRKLLQSVEHSGMSRFEMFQLFTGDAVASRFYEALGYSPVEGQWKVSHAKRITAQHGAWS